MEGGGEGGGGMVGEFRDQNTQAAKLLVQQLTETATMGPDHSMGRTVVAMPLQFSSCHQYSRCVSGKL